MALLFCFLFWNCSNLADNYLLLCCILNEDTKGLISNKLSGHSGETSNRNKSNVIHFKRRIDANATLTLIERLRFDVFACHCAESMLTSIKDRGSSELGQSSGKTVAISHSTKKETEQVLLTVGRTDNQRYNLNPTTFMRQDK